MRIDQWTFLIFAYRRRHSTLSHAEQRRLFDMRYQMTAADWRSFHGVIFVVLMMAGLLVPPLRRWPWLWIVPLAGYFGIVTAAARLRRNIHWLRVGRITVASIAVSLATMILSSAALLWFYHSTEAGHVSGGSALPLNTICGGWLGGAAFALLNGTLEEVVFRGILFDALDSQWGKWMTLLVTSLAFGIGHLHGYPPGVAGAFLAGVYGLVLGGLRIWTGGLALPIVVPIAADATIYCLLME